MAHPNEELIRRGYDAFARGDMDTLRELFDRGARRRRPKDREVLVFHVRDGKVVEVCGSTSMTTTPTTGSSSRRCS